MTIGFIGLGIMGSRMAANLQAAGHDLVVYNRTKAKADALIAKGAVWAESPAAVGSQTETLFTMLAHPHAVRVTALGEHGFLDTLKPGALWVDCSTVNPSFSRAMAGEANARRLRFLDAPVAGSKGAAANADLLFLVGGNADNLEACRDLLDLMGRRIVHVGPHGMGTSLKMVVNMLLATSMATFAEGMALGQSLGIPQETLFELLMGGPVVAPFVQGKRDKMAQADYEAEFPLRWMQKDLQLATETGYESGVAMPVANVTKEVYRLAMQAGLAELDFSAIYGYLTQQKE